jgi:two-component sensor histidine kinase
MLRPLREIHHRVKNNLKVVSSLLSIKAMQTPNTEASNTLMESCRRIQMMADIHNRLYGSLDIAQIEVDDFVRKVTKNLVSAYSQEAVFIHLAQDLESFTLNIDAAIPCSLIISELVCNAMKHAFPGRTEGSIAVVLKRHGDKLHLRVKGNGIGKTQAHGSQPCGSLGLMLVHAPVEKLNGDIVCSNEKGACTTITFDAEQAS